MNSKIDLQKQKEKEDWHKIVVKVISWKSGVPKSGSVSKDDKITPKEWNIYKKKILETNLSISKDQVMRNLRQIQDTIKSFGGFAS